QPLMDAADRFRAAFAPVPAVEEQIEIELVAADIVGERRRRTVPGRPDRALVVGALRDLDESPLRPVHLLAVRVLRERHAHERAVRRVAPAVIRALELHGVALVVAADLHPAMAARIQKDANTAGAIAAEDHRLLAHRRDEVVVGLGNLALVADEQPRPREDLLLLLTIDLFVDEDLAADDPAVDVDEILQVVHFGLFSRISSYGAAK